MRNLLAFVGAAVVVFLGLGWYLGWYSVTPQKVGPGKSSLQVDINQGKIGQDVKKVAEGVQESIEKARQNQAAPNSDEQKPGAKLDKPMESKPTQGKPTNSASSRAKDAFGDFIFDGWGSGEKK